MARLSLSQGTGLHQTAFNGRIKNIEGKDDWRRDALINFFYEKWVGQAT